jgi:hypothetical protein
MATKTLTFSKGGVATRDVATDTTAIERQIGTVKSLVVVLEQSLKPGTTVLKGTPVDIVLAVTDKFNLSIIQDLPQEWTAKTIGDVAAVARVNPPVLDIFNNVDSAASLNADQKQVLVSFGKSLGITVNPNDPVSLDGALNAGRGAYQLSSSNE